MDDHGHTVFNELLFRRGQPYFYAFDLIGLNGHDLRSLRVVERNERLKALHVDGYGIDFSRMICEKNLEGSSENFSGGQGARGEDQN